MYLWADYTEDVTEARSLIKEFKKPGTTQVERKKLASAIQDALTHPILFLEKYKTNFPFVYYHFTFTHWRNAYHRFVKTYDYFMYYEFPSLQDEERKARTEAKMKALAEKMDFVIINPNDLPTEKDDLTVDDGWVEVHADSPDF